MTYNTVCRLKLVYTHFSLSLYSDAALFCQTPLFHFEKTTHEGSISIVKDELAFSRPQRAPEVLIGPAETGTNSISKGCSFGISRTTSSFILFTIPSPFKNTMSVTRIPSTEHFLQSSRTNFSAVRSWRYTARKISSSSEYPSSLYRRK
jgi:hypothetical protein